MELDCNPCAVHGPKNAYKVFIRDQNMHLIQWLKVSQLLTLVWLDLYSFPSVLAWLIRFVK